MSRCLAAVVLEQVIGELTFSASVQRAGLAVPDILHSNDGLNLKYGFE